MQRCANNDAFRNAGEWIAPPNNKWAKKPNDNAIRQLCKLQLAVGVEYHASLANIGKSRFVLSNLAAKLWTNNKNNRIRNIRACLHAYGAENILRWLPMIAQIWQISTYTERGSKQRLQLSNFVKFGASNVARRCQGVEHGRLRRHCMPWVPPFWEMPFFSTDFPFSRWYLSLPTWAP